MSFTAAVREELAHLPPGRDCCQRAETGVLLRLAGSYRLVGGGEGIGYVMTSPSAAVVRRARSTLQRLRAPSELHVVQPGRLQAGVSYRLVLMAPAVDPLTGLGLLGGSLHPPDGLLTRELSRPCDMTAGVRGALLAAASISAPGSDPHLELGAPGRQSVLDLAELVRRCGAAGARAGQHQGQWRVVVKSVEGIGMLLARAGAHSAFIRWDQERMHRELRRDAARGANADRANVSRSVAAAARQVAAVEHAVARVGWEDLAEDLREVALVRLANPEASLAELGSLLDPPAGKSTVHRRLTRLTELGRAHPEAR